MPLSNDAAFAVISVATVAVEFFPVVAVEKYLLLHLQLKCYCGCI